MLNRTSFLTMNLENSLNKWNKWKKQFEKIKTIQFLYKEYFAYKRSFAERYGVLVGTMRKLVFDSIYTCLQIMVLWKSQNLTGRPAGCPAGCRPNAGRMPAGCRPDAGQMPAAWTSMHGYPCMDIRAWISMHGYPCMDFHAWIVSVFL